jgi:hypothetical protein
MKSATARAVLVARMPEMSRINTAACRLRDECKLLYRSGEAYAIDNPDEEFDPGASKVYINGRSYNVLAVLDILDAIGVADSLIRYI